MMRVLLVLYFIGASIRYKVAPWKFFQLNSTFFNEDKGLFSKLDLDRVIPERWYLRQVKDDGVTLPDAFPVFVKPEWGQNSYAVTRADCADTLADIRAKNEDIESEFILQQVARERLEFEVFYIRSADNFAQYEILSITETKNSNGERYPVNGIYNPESFYRDRTGDFSDKEQQQLWRLLSTIGTFRIARVGLRADSPEDMLAGSFHIIEINIFLPMPLYLLDKSVPWREKHSFIVRSMMAAAQMVGTLPSTQKTKKIFFRKLRAHYRVKP